MLDMGFLPDVTKIVEHTPAERQTLLFSATIDSSIQKNLGNLLKDPAVIEIARNGETAATVAQYIMPIANRKKQELLEAVLNDKGHERVIVFARTKNRTEECAPKRLRPPVSTPSPSTPTRPRAAAVAPWRTSAAAKPTSWWPPTCWHAASTCPR